jgi:RNA polymerase sigma-70 factor, ECF subfamily
MLETSHTLLARLRQPGEQAAWNRFVDLYTPLLYSWARRTGLQEDDAADLVQDVFTILLRKLPEFSYDSRRSFRAWLRTVTMNHWRNDRRRLGRQPAGQNVALDELPGGEDPDLFWETDYRRHLVACALRVMQAEFEPTTWRACWETTVGDRPAAEVAAELGISENAVYIAKYRVTRRLREELEGLMD